MRWLPLRHRSTVVAFVFFLALALLPFVSWHIPWILPGPDDILNSTGTLAPLAICFLFAGVAVGYDLIFGFTGLLSLGQALFFGIGAYVFTVTVTDWNWPFFSAIAVTFGVALVVAVISGAVALRVPGMAFAMVTLAFAQAFYFVIESNPHNLTGGDSGLSLNDARLPFFAQGAVSNTPNLYWVALAFLFVSTVVVWTVTSSETGHLFVAIRENERRLEVLGVRTYRYKLLSVVISSVIAAGGGIVYVLVIGTVLPSSVAATSVSISILIMVVLGGPGTRWGALGGAMVYEYLQQYLNKVSSEPSFANLPAVLRVPLSQPQFLLGALFIVFVIFVPGGFAGLYHRRRAKAFLSAGDDVARRTIMDLFKKHAA
jgi:branched-chain amino acid transport system permease protein